VSILNFSKFITKIVLEKMIKSCCGKIINMAFGEQILIVEIDPDIQDMSTVLSTIKALVSITNQRLL